MEEEKLKQLLNKLPERMSEPVRPGFAEDIKAQIPQQLRLHKMGMNTINIIIDLRISRLAAAAAIIVTIILCAHFFGFRESTGGAIIQAIEYSLVGEQVGRSEMLEDMKVLCEEMVKDGKEVVYYGASVDPENRFSVLMHWKLPDGRYRVIFSDLSMATVSSDMLILLQSHMLQERKQK